ncbi:LEUCINE-RICH REPEAT SERINE/THREONINE-PROTEIN KINASE 1 [Salix purpurea]|uniref:LEUCINE-RICH REPEAT SERINE/THREONINE-PROTEIN KINASE 1 n=1 Tax=Salix purpurea TaxID=77065 RepID=A0A9Q1A3N7_SALPP|nr:LEUCINE-RICH REPEAT SERINE/THREONINE-PROTEIN KINASE 1 [Salix purpurea]
MAVPFFLSVLLLLLLLLLCQHGSGFKFRSTARDQEPSSSERSHCQENPYTDEGLPCDEVDALEKIIVNLGLPEPLTSRNYCSKTDDRSISFKCDCNGSPTNRSCHITSLVTYGIRLSGQIDERLSNLTHLTEIDLSDNQLHGTIPESLGKLTRLKILNLEYNQLSGKIPPTLGNLKALQTLR